MRRNRLYFRVYEAVLPDRAALDDIWRQPFAATLAGLGLQMEAITYSADGIALIATAGQNSCSMIETPVR